MFFHCVMFVSFFDLQFIGIVVLVMVRSPKSKLLFDLIRLVQVDVLSTQSEGDKRRWLPRDTGSDSVTFFQIVEWACVLDSMNITIRVVLSVDPTYFICKSHFKHLLPSEVNYLECLYCIVLYVLADLDNK